MNFTRVGCLSVLGLLPTTTLVAQEGSQPSEIEATPESALPTLLTAEPASAVKPVPAVGEELPPRNWALAAGVGMPYFADNIRDLALLLSVPVAVVAASRRPELQLLVERRTSDKRFFIFQVSGDYARDSNDDTTDSAWVGTASLGVRHLYNPGGVVEVSTFAVGALSYASLSETYNDSMSSEGSAWTIGGGLGFCLDRKLIDALYLRFSTLILKATYTSSSGETVDSFGDTASAGDSSRIIAGLDLKPSVQLRLEF
jgi:hypothetical protein